MSNRAKVKPNRGPFAAKVDAFYPVVTTAEETGEASRLAVARLLELMGPWRAGGVDVLMWRGHTKALELLRSLADSGAVPSDERHAAMQVRAIELGEAAVLLLARCKMLAVGAS